MPIQRTGFKVVPAVLNFGNVQQSTTPAPMTVVVTNISTSGPVSFYITPDDPRFTSPQAGNHTLTNPGDTLTVSFTFAATAILGGVTSNYINFIGFTPPTTAYQLAANVVSSATPSFVVTPGAINFGSLKVGTSSSSAGVIVTNNGAVNITINSVALVPVDFALSGLPSLPTTLTPGSSFTFNVSANSSFRGFNDYSPGIVVTPSVGAPVSVELIYTGFIITPAYVLTGNQQAVFFGHTGFWDNGFLSQIVQASVSLPCETICTLLKQIDFNNPGYNTYLSKIFMRTEPSGNLVVNVQDTTIMSNTVTTKSAQATVTSTLDTAGIVRWLQFDLENNGESHKIFVQVNALAGIMILDLYIVQYEQRGPVYEGT